MSCEVARDLLYHLAGDDAKIGYASETDSIWLEELPLPLGMKRMLQWYWPQSGIQIGPIVFEPVAGIRSYPTTLPFLEHKLIFIGSCPNGDELVWDFATEDCNVGFVTHTQYDGEGDPRPYYQASFRTLASFLHRVESGLYVPGDYDEAYSYAAFLETESKHKHFPHRD